MFAMYRPGPYICGEWEWGGLPAWLLRDPQMQVRTNYTPYLNAIEKYYEKLLNVIHDHQFTVKGGPIIAMQIENEFGSWGNTITKKADHDYLEFIKNTATKYGFKELYFTSDGPDQAADRYGTLPGFNSYQIKLSIFRWNLSLNVFEVLSKLSKILK
jgi:beta-galactosidase